MSEIGRLKSIAGGQQKFSMASAASMVVPDEINVVWLTGSATVTSLTAALSSRGRMVYFIQDDTGSTVFTNTNNTTTAGQMDLGGSNITLGQTDVLCLVYRHADGTWLRIFSTDN